MDDCFFCSTTHDEIYSDSRCFVMLHEDRAVRGHAMVVWRGHVENLSDLAPDDATHLLQVFVAAERALLQTTGAQRAILLKLGIQTPHLHLHIYPVSAQASRSDVMAALDGKTREEVAADFVSRLRSALGVAGYMELCPCCGYRTLSERGAFEICRVCFWEDDGQGDDDVDEVLGGPNGELSLSQARANFRTLGAVEERFLKNVRPPQPGELP